MSQQNSTALGGETFICKDQVMQANAVEGTNESQLDLLLTQPFTPIFLSTEDRQEEKLLEEVEAFMKEPLSGENHENVDVHEQKMTNYEYIEPLYQTEFGASFVPTELSTTKNELVNIYRELALQKGLKADPFMGHKPENL